MVETAEERVSNIDWPDFQDLVHLIMARSGWQRTSWIGGARTEPDLEFIVPGIGVRAYVCLRPEGDQRDLDDFVARHTPPHSHIDLYFICQNPIGTVDTDFPERVEVWPKAALANGAIKNGLYEWLITRCV